MAIDDKLRLKLAKTRMQEIKAFYMMLGGFVILMPYLVFVNMKTTPDYHWFWFPVIGCGISLLGYSIYLFSGKKWEQNKIRKIMSQKQ